MKNPFTNFHFGLIEPGSDVKILTLADGPVVMVESTDMTHKPKVTAF